MKAIIGGVFFNQEQVKQGKQLGFWKKPFFFFFFFFAKKGSVLTKFIETPQIQIYLGGLIWVKTKSLYRGRGVFMYHDQNVFGGSPIFQNWYLRMGTPANISAPPLRNYHTWLRRSSIDSSYKLDF